MLFSVAFVSSVVKMPVKLAQPHPTGKNQSATPSATEWNKVNLHGIGISK
jgi:hypothetical protein